jgi:transposase-like protein
MTGSLEEAVLEMYLQGVSTRKVEAITGKLSGVKLSKDAVSRIASRLDERLSEWRSRRLDKAYSYLYLDATYMKATWAGAVRTVALLVAIGVCEEGYREVLSVEIAPGERTDGYRSVLKGLLERGLRGVRLVTSDDHGAIKKAVEVELPQAAWQRCVVHFERNILAHVPQTEMKAVASDLKVIFQAARRETAESLASSFSARYGALYPKAVAVLASGLAEALTYTAHRVITSTSARPTA